MIMWLLVHASVGHVPRHNAPQQVRVLPAGVRKRSNKKRVNADIRRHYDQFRAAGI